jgi:hypothetical protein
MFDCEKTAEGSYFQTIVLVPLSSHSTAKPQLDALRSKARPQTCTWRSRSKSWPMCSITCASEAVVNVRPEAANAASNVDSGTYPRLACGTPPMRLLWSVSVCESAAASLSSCSLIRRGWAHRVPPRHAIRDECETLRPRSTAYSLLRSDRASLRTPCSPHTMVTASRDS